MATTEPTAAAARQPATTAPLLGEPLPVELMNTVWADREGRHDSLTDARDLAAWLAAVAPHLPEGAPAPAGAAGADVTDTLVVEYRALRDALRRLAAAATGDDRPAALDGSPSLAEAVASVNRACALAPGWSRLAWPDGGDPARTTVSSHSPAAAALSAVAEQAARLFAGPERPELRACRAPGCVLYFLRTHPRREWCSAACGNRARVARHYQRHHAPGTRG
jgi:predicted RNA-binding Zn ribbon-like protein